MAEEEKKQEEKKSDIEGLIKRYLGYKFFRSDPKDDNKLELVRIVKTYSNNKDVDIQYEDKHKEKVDIHYLTNYRAIKPNALTMFSIIELDDKMKQPHQDVVVAAYQIRPLKPYEINYPYVVCRQSVNDFFYQMINPNDEYYGVSVTMDDIPAGIDYKQLMYCTRLIRGVCVNTYMDDSVDDVLNCVYIAPYDKVLDSLYTKHALASTDPTLSFKSIDHGWCRHLKDLLKINNFDIDFENMFKISIVDFVIADYLVKKDDEVDALNQEALIWFDYTFKVNAVDSSVIEYGLDINLSKFQNTNYTVLRDKANKLYLIVYLEQGQYLESDLMKKYSEPDVTTKLRMKFFNGKFDSQKQ